MSIDLLSLGASHQGHIPLAKHLAVISIGSPSLPRSGYHSQLATRSVRGTPQPDIHQDTKCLHSQKPSPNNQSTYHSSWIPTHQPCDQSYEIQTVVVVFSYRGGTPAGGSLSCDTPLQPSSAARSIPHPSSRRCIPQNHFRHLKSRLTVVQVTVYSLRALSPPQDSPDYQSALKVTMYSLKVLSPFGTWLTTHKVTMYSLRVLSLFGTWLTTHKVTMYSSQPLSLSRDSADHRIALKVTMYSLRALSLPQDSPDHRPDLKVTMYSLQVLSPFGSWPTTHKVTMYSSQPLSLSRGSADHRITLKVTMYSLRVLSLFGTSPTAHKVTMYSLRILPPVKTATRPTTHRHRIFQPSHLVTVNSRDRSRLPENQSLGHSIFFIAVLAVSI